MLNYRHYLAGLPTHLSLGLLEEKGLPETVLDQIKTLFPALTTDRLFNRFQLLDKLEGKNPAFVLVIPSRNNEAYIKANLGSIARQSYQNYRVIYLDDISTDQTREKVMAYAEHYQLTNRLKLIKMPERNRQGAARFRAYHMCDDDEIICMLDGDDWLYDAEVLTRLAGAYHAGAMATYGSYVRFENGQLQSFVYGPGEDFDHGLVKQVGIRRHRWITQHLRTGYAGLFKRIRYQDLVDADNCFLKVATDVCEMMPVLEMAYPQIAKISQPTYVYNVDASNRHQTSYFRVGQFPEQAKTRQSTLDQIKNGRPYPRVLLPQLRRERLLYPTYQRCSSLEQGQMVKNKDYLVIGQADSSINDQQIEGLVKVLDACGLPLLVKGLSLVSARFVFSRQLAIGYRRELPKVNFCIIAGHLLNYLREDDEGITINPTLLGDPIVSLILEGERVSNPVT